MEVTIMRRIISACLLQTMRFDTANEASPEQELEIFCRKLDRNKVDYIIEETVKEDDGSIVVKLRKQYNTYKTTGYMGS